ncbi:rRNA processing/ribosome biogenesis-domain-containing protein [Immersiella caudata]|uniref:Pre-rRNA-processing protein RIX1 n=1 Tax=Immersiella caudata TaxID=314043 RepID=A0AA39WXQ0_9PEZI|nr:rRNA processing/ribosome biogenesis-domain-containing protein [Immersiella caudata]
MSVPPELRVLCKRLVSTPTEELPRLAPMLVGLVLRCGAPLSAVQDTKSKDKASEAPMLVHKLRTHITTLLNGRSTSGRFAAACLIKAVIDVGGWETLRLADAWIRGLISALQKPDSLVTKELCLVALTKIYVFLQGYPTLAREMATPTLPDYVKACLQLIKPPSSGKALKAPAAFIGTVACSLARLLPLFPTTLRTFSAQITTALKAYVAPTTSDADVVPRSLRESSRRVLILLHYTAPKNGSSDEWLKRIRTTIRDCHTTADQIFRAVQESWESTAGYRSQAVRTDVDPSGGGDAAEEFPSWAGVTAGSERLVGLLEFLADHLRISTKNPVAVPLGEILDLASRMSLMTIPASDDQADLNPAISRDEKAELWSVLPDIHQAVISLHTVIIRRIGSNAVSFSTDIIDQVVRILNSDRSVPAIRQATYTLMRELLPLSGPALPKLTVDSLNSLIHTCCQDTLCATGFFNPEPQQTLTSTIINGTTKPKDPISTNADAYLAKPTGSETAAASIPRTPHETAAYILLALLLSHIPQRHLTPDSRALLDRTAILSNSKEAMIASVLHPYKDSRGRYYPSILPFLIKRYPHDQDIEVLRTNLVRSSRLGSNETTQGGLWEETREEATEGDSAEDEDVPMEDTTAAPTSEETEKQVPKVISAWEAAEAGTYNKTEMDVDPSPPAERNAFFTTVTTTATEIAAVVDTTALGEENRKIETPLSPLKRKASQVGGDKTKRVDTGKGGDAKVEVRGKKDRAREGETDSDSDSDGESVEIDMTFDEEEEEEEEGMNER